MEFIFVFLSFSLVCRSIVRVLTIRNLKFRGQINSCPEGLIPGEEEEEKENGERVLLFDEKLEIGCEMVICKVQIVLSFSSIHALQKLPLELKCCSLRRGIFAYLNFFGTLKV